MDLRFNWYVECAELKVAACVEIDGVKTAIRMEVPDKLQELVSDYYGKLLKEHQDSRDFLRRR